jgi:hypothetical protein
MAYLTPVIFREEDIDYCLNIKLLMALCMNTVMWVKGRFALKAS